MVRRIFGPKRDEMEGWRKLYNEEFHSLYSSVYNENGQVKDEVRKAGHVARVREKMNAYRIFVRKPKGKRE
jgi:hypothetical protein